MAKFVQAPQAKVAADELLMEHSVDVVVLAKSATASNGPLTSHWAA